MSSYLRYLRAFRVCTMSKFFCKRSCPCDQGCQMVHLPKSPNLGSFWRAFECENVSMFYGKVVFLRPFVNFIHSWYIFCGHLVWYVLSVLRIYCFGMLYLQNLATLIWYVLSVLRIYCFGMLYLQNLANPLWMHLTTYIQPRPSSSFNGVSIIIAV
jgi:hypothetical protein